MDCEFLERVSLLIDGEMSSKESEQVRKHIDACAVCRRAEQEFLLVRQQIRSYKSEPDQHRARRVLREITGRKAAPWWSRKIALPVPAFALIVLLMLAVVSWSLTRPASPEQGKDERDGKPLVTDRPVAGQSDFSRFDHGERAVIYKVRRTAAGILEQ